MQRLRFARHCWPVTCYYGTQIMEKRLRGNPAIAYINQLLTKTRPKSIDELKIMIDERYVWRTMVIEHLGSSTRGKGSKY